MRFFYSVYSFFFFGSLVSSIKYSFLSTGQWESMVDNPHNNDNLCHHHYLCTPPPEQFTWKSDHSQWKYYFQEEACTSLIAKGIKQIFFYGDSFMRHIYSALLLTLTGDYNSGSIENPLSNPECSFHKQFNEKHCGEGELRKTNVTVCQGKLHLIPAFVYTIPGIHFLEDLHDCNQGDDGIVILFSYGNHIIGPNRVRRTGVNDAKAYQEMVFSQGICAAALNAPFTITGEVNRCSLWWVSTHARLLAYHDDESSEKIENYNEEMKIFMEDKNKCGNTNYIDVYNMTHSLIHHVLKDGLGVEGDDKDNEQLMNQLTYDKVHWGMEVNLVKAQIVLNALMLAPVKSKKNKWGNIVENQE